MNLKIKHVPILTVLCAGAIPALIISWLTFVPGIKKKIETQDEYYLEALTSLTAKQMVEAAFSSDLVSMQVQLTDIADQPNTLFAAVYDAENTLLVQAGDPHFLADKTVTQTKAITLEESIAGYVSVTIEKTPGVSLPSQLFIGLLVMLLTFLAGWSLYESKALDIQLPNRFKKPKEEPEEEDLPKPSTPVEKALPQEEPAPLVYAILHIKNLGVLRQQLSGESFRKTISKLERILADVLALYGGEEFYLEDNHYTLCFRATDSEGEALFRAICSAHLTLELSGIVNKVPLDLAALVTTSDQDLKAEQLPIAGLHIEEAVAAESIIDRRIQIMDVSDDESRKVVSGFQQPFQTLLENQRKQLNQII